MRTLLTASATSIASLIRDREVTSREVVELHLAEVQRVNPSLNAVVQHRAEEARAEADRADAVVDEAGGELPPLHGVPCTVKENFALRGSVQRRPFLLELCDARLFIHFLTAD